MEEPNICLLLTFRLGDKHSRKNTLEHLNCIFVEGRPSKMTLPESLKHLDIIQMKKITQKKELSWKRVECLPLRTDWLIPEPLKPSHSRALLIEGSLLTSQINFKCILTYIAIFRSTQTTLSGHFAATLKHKCAEEGEHLLKSDGRAIVAARRAAWTTSETADLLWFSQTKVSRV